MSDCPRCADCNRPESAFMMGLSKNGICYPCWIDRAENAEARVAELEAKCKTWQKRAERYANDAYNHDEAEAIKLMWEFQDNVT